MAKVVVMGPLLAATVDPVAEALTSSGFTLSIPRYSRARTSTIGWALDSVTVTVLVLAALRVRP